MLLSLFPDPGVALLVVRNSFVQFSRHSCGIENKELTSPFPVAMRKVLQT
jgi:hypothetical protein